MLAATLAADLDAWTRLLLLHDEPEVAAAEPETIRTKLYHLPARLTTHARRRTLHLDSYRDPVLLAGPDDPIASGDSRINEVTLAAPGDWNNDGQADLVVRYDRPDVGGLHVFHGEQGDNGYDISVTDRTAIGSNWSTSTVPTFVAAPDADNDGRLDLWATTPDSGRIRAFRGITDSGTEQVTVASKAFTGYQTIG